MPVDLVPVRCGHAQKARGDCGKPGGDNKVDHGCYPLCEARGGAGVVGFRDELWRARGDGVEED